VRFLALFALATVLAAQNAPYDLIVRHGRIVDGTGGPWDKATFDKPYQYVEGAQHVIVSGKAVLQDGKMTSARPGVVLYGPARQK
jgi:hypothetical protein